MRAEVPNWDVEDVRAMYLEDTIGQDCGSAMDIFNKVQMVRPAMSALVIPDPNIEGVQMMRSKQAFEELPFFSWWEIFTFQGVTPPKGVKPPKGK